MHRLWLLMAFVILVLIDLSLLPMVVIGITAGSTLAPAGHRSASLPAIALAVVLGVGLMGLTFVVGRAWHRAPLPKPPPPPN
jgi:hypothetical protein